MNERRQGILTSIGLLVLRVGVGGLLMTHGWAKVMLIVNGQFDKLGDPIGMGPTLSTIAAAGAEFVCGLLVAVGLLTRIAAVPAAFTMAVAAFVVHAPDPHTMTEAMKLGLPKSKEPALLFLVPMVTLIFTGPGWFSLDALVYPYLSRRRARRRDRSQQHQQQSQPQ